MDDSEIFEIEDYTNASDYETFIKALEQAFSNSINTPTNLKFKNFEFAVTHYSQPLAKQTPNSEFASQNTHAQLSIW